jgi:serine/threonine-protein kinase HipA
MARVRADVVLMDGSPDGIPVGAVAEQGGRIAFQYRPEFVASGVGSISPIMMPLSSRVYEFPSLQRTEAFGGLPGVLADSLPDRFGTRIMEAYFRAKGIAPGALSPVQRLLYVGQRAMGALAFSPPFDQSGDSDVVLPLTLGLLRDQARRAIRGDVATGLREIMAAASSAGGMRAKALIAWNRETNEVDYGSTTSPPGFEAWLLKFDGVGADGEPEPWCRMEYAYTRMGAACGIEVPEVELIREGEFCHFATRRFDRGPNGERIHMASLCGLQHADFNLPGAFGYELMFDTCHALQLGAGTIEEAYRRMVFNVLSRNQDDHTKNSAFTSRLGQDGALKWDLSPAYDLTYANGAGWTRVHQMTICGKAEGIERSDLLTVAERYGVRRAEQIIDEVAAVVSSWRDFADEAGVPEEWIERCAADHRLHLAVRQQTPAPGLR